jgi:NitT/TauT family transport system ATP-binding protein
MPNKIILHITSVSQWFGNNRVLHDIDLNIVQGQFVALVGASGCGKSTLLRAILGTVPPKEGAILTDGKPVTGPNRDVGIVYQRYGLYQFLTAEENVAFGLMLDQTRLWERIFRPWKWRALRKKHLEQARDLLIEFKLEHALNHYPRELSGGMRQRVAVAQALIMKPKILLLDEPFGALDESTREELQEMLLRLYQDNVEARKRGQQPLWTVIIITHELNEAFYVADRVIGLSRNWYQELKEGETVTINGTTYSGRIEGKFCGATKIWDKCAPIFQPDDPKDFARFYDVKQELKRVVLDEDSPPVERSAHVSFWSDLEKGLGTGVAGTKTLAPTNLSRIL